MYKITRALLQLMMIRLADTGGKQGPAFICARPSSNVFVFQDYARAASTELQCASTAFGSASCLLYSVAGECACRRGMFALLQLCCWKGLVHPVSQLVLSIWQGSVFRRLLAGQLVCVLAGARWCELGC